MILLNENVNKIYNKINIKKILFPYLENSVDCKVLFTLRSAYPEWPNFTICSTLPKGFIIPAKPLFDDLTTYLPFSIALKILWTKCCFGPIDCPNHPSSEIFIIRSKLGLLNKLPE